MKDVDFFTPGARLALELECLLMDTRDAAVQSRWWDSAHEALEQWRQAVRAMEAAIDAAQQPANDEVVFIDGVGAGRRSVESCRDGVQWIMVGDRVYWPLSDADAQRLQSACCGNGSFDGPSTVVQPAASSEAVNVIGMPEFDGLLDHIYEHGTAAEGVIEKANAFARAVIARYAPQQRAAVDEVKEPDLWRCTVCGRFGTVGRCCGEETRERANMEQLMAEVERLRTDLMESDEIREKLGHLLTRTAAALKGEPPAGVWHSWHDLPEKAAQLVERVQQDEALLRQALESLESGDGYIEQLELIVYSPDDTGTHEERAKVQSAIAALRERLGEGEPR